MELCFENKKQAEIKCSLYRREISFWRYVEHNSALLSLCIHPFVFWPN